MSIVFVDEVGFSFLADTGTTWAPRAHPPILRRKSERRALSSMVFLTDSGKLYRKHFEHTIHGEDVIEGLKHLNRCLPGRKAIVWDHLSAHLSKEVKQYLLEHKEIEIHELPSYAPELNPEEQCNDNFKQHMLNGTPQSVEDIARTVDRQIHRLRQRPDLLHSFFAHAGIAVNPFP